MGSLQDMFNYVAGSIGDLGAMFVGNVNDAFDFVNGSLANLFG
ncbi:hypothetical protein [Tomitella cavernea]|uniref:Uncharacterized protein n=1 Tax=Tomitella cavernea TaxID=1387982 RepID=A0ABP9CVV3_9ACTN|nr:hypothetical protein [Tomitella cavernea]